MPTVQGEADALPVSAMSETPTFDTGALMASIPEHWASCDGEHSTAGYCQLDRASVLAEAQKLAEQAYWSGRADEIADETKCEWGVPCGHPDRRTPPCSRCKRLAEARRRAGGAE
jgi:hypothetical protein